MCNIENDKWRSDIMRFDIFGDGLHDDSAGRRDDKTTRAIAKDANRQEASSRLFKKFLKLILVKKCHK